MLRTNGRAPSSAFAATWRSHCRGAQAAWRRKPIFRLRPRATTSKRHPRRRPRTAVPCGPLPGAGGLAKRLQQRTVTTQPNQRADLEDQRNQSDRQQQAIADVQRCLGAFGRSSTSSTPTQTWPRWRGLPSPSGTKASISTRLAPRTAAREVSSPRRRAKPTPEIRRRRPIGSPLPPRTQPAHGPAAATR